MTDDELEKLKKMATQANVFELAECGANHGRILNMDRSPAQILSLISRLEAAESRAARFKEALERISKHGCCVMHNDRGCPGCESKQALADGATGAEG